jgi:16S rRNA (guanine(966)-N(2))-methyltransferase RsmD
MLEHRGWLADADLVDLYAGSGALGIEALSRGARSVVFVESSPGAVRALRSNLAACDLADRAEVVPASVERALRLLTRRGARADGVMADPPYRRGVVQPLVDMLARGALLASAGWVAIEHAPEETPDPRPGLDRVLCRRHGGTAVSLFQRSEMPA